MVVRFVLTRLLSVHLEVVVEAAVVSFSCWFLSYDNVNPDHLLGFGGGRGSYGGGRGGGYSKSFLSLLT